MFWSVWSGHVVAVWSLCVIQAIDNEFSTSISAQLSTLTQRIGQYQRDNENVNVPRLYATVEALKQTTHDLAKRFVASICYNCLNFNGLQVINNFIYWH